MYKAIELILYRIITFKTTAGNWNKTKKKKKTTHTHKRHTNFQIYYRTFANTRKQSK